MKLQRWPHCMLLTLLIATAAAGGWLGWQVKIVHDRKARSISPPARKIATAAEQYGLPDSLIPWNTDQSLINNVRCDRQQRVNDYLPIGDIASSWAPTPAIEI